MIRFRPYQGSQTLVAPQHDRVQHECADVRTSEIDFWRLDSNSPRVLLVESPSESDHQSHHSGAQVPEAMLNVLDVPVVRRRVHDSIDLNRAARAVPRRAWTGRCPFESVRLGGKASLNQRDSSTSRGPARGRCHSGPYGPMHGSALDRSCVGFQTLDACQSNRVSMHSEGRGRIVDAEPTPCPYEREDRKPAPEA